MILVDDLVQQVEDFNAQGFVASNGEPLVVTPDEGMFATLRYIETLEQAVLDSWYYDHYLCDVCKADNDGFRVDLSKGEGHNEDCIVPALLEKYLDA